MAVCKSKVKPSATGLVDFKLGKVVIDLSVSLDSFVAGPNGSLAKAKALAKDKDVGIGGASAAQQALTAGLVDELYLHISPILLGDGVSSNTMTKRFIYGRSSHTTRMM
jgi:dihydrofolate reductase